MKKINKIFLSVMVFIFLSFFTNIYAEVIENPIRVNSIGKLVAILLDLVVKISMPIIVLFMIYSGFLFVTAGGDETQLTKARQAFLYTVIGTAVILGASLLASVIEGTITELGTGIIN